LRIAQLIDRLRSDSDKIKEVILATNPSLEGEATAVYLAERIRPMEIKVTRLARGLPVGGIWNMPMNLLCRAPSREERSFDGGENE